jgi:hypothetical protein
MRFTTRAILHTIKPRRSHFLTRLGPSGATKAATPVSSATWLLMKHNATKPWSTTSKAPRQGANACDSSARWVAALAARIVRRSANSISFSFMSGRSTPCGLWTIP